MTEQTPTPEAEALADAILKAAGSGLRHYTMAKTREEILAAAQRGIDAAASNAICPYVVTSDGGTSYCRLAESSEKARDAEVAELVGALETAKALTAKYKDVVEASLGGQGIAELREIHYQAEEALAKHKQEG